MDTWRLDASVSFGLAVPGRPMQSLVAGDRERRTASATGRDRRSRAGVREPQLCDDPHAGLSRTRTPAMPRDKAVANG
jgi:hypothetical protein